MDTRVDRRKAERGHAYELFVDGDAAARLEWRRDPTRRSEVGWWFDRYGSGRPPRHLNVDASIRDLGLDERRPAPEWCDDADSLALLTTEAALDRAEQLLLGRIAAGAALGGNEPGRFEILLTGVDAVTVASALPASAIYGWGGMTVVTGVFDDASMRATLDRLAQVGGDVLGILPADPD